MQAGRRSQCALVRCLYTRALPENEIPPAKLVDIYCDNYLLLWNVFNAARNMLRLILQPALQNEETEEQQSHVRRDQPGNDDGSNDVGDKNERSSTFHKERFFQLRSKACP